MKTLVKCKEQVIKCAFCGAAYRLEKPKDYRKIRSKKREFGWGSAFRNCLTCKCCKKFIEVEGVGK